MAEEAEPGQHRHRAPAEPEPQVPVDPAPAAGDHAAPDDHPVQGHEGRGHPDPPEDGRQQRSPQGQVAAVAGDRPQEEVPGPEEGGGDPDERGRGHPGPGHGPPPGRPEEQERHRQGGQEGGLLAQAGEGQAQTGQHRLPPTRGHHGRGHGQEHEDLEAGGLGVGREVGRGAGQEEHAGGDGRGPVARAPLRLQGQEEGGAGQGQAADGPHRADVAPAGGVEDGGVEVGDRGGLAVGRLVVEGAAPLDLHGHGGQAGLVGVEQPSDQAGDVEEEGGGHERQAEAHGPPALRGRRRRRLAKAHALTAWPSSDGTRVGTGSALRRPPPPPARRWRGRRRPRSAPSR